MEKTLSVFLLGLSFITFSWAQQTFITGSVKNTDTQAPIPEATITLEETQQTTTTDNFGMFTFNKNVPLGEQILNVSKEGYITERYPIIVNNGQIVNITDIILSPKRDDANLYTIILTDDELNNDTAGFDNISGLLQASQDIFERTAAFEFSSSFFKVRGLGSENGTVLINGVEMNKLYDGRPQWSNWGGLNDVLRNQELTSGLTPSFYNFGGALGTTNINTRASLYKKGGRITYSSSNRSYTNRVMAFYATGIMEKGFAAAFSIGRRWGNEGYQDATTYDANSFFIAIEYKFNDRHSLNLTSIYTPNRRGKSSPNTQEVYDLKDIRYNEYWGYQNGEKRNSRIKEIVEPIVILNHYWNLNNSTSINTNIAFQLGRIGNSRLDYNGTDLVNGFPEGGGANPSPTYYQKLPSFFLRNNPDDLGAAYMAQQAFINNGQIDWNLLYTANISNTQQGGNAIYALYEDRTDDKQFTVNTIIQTELSETITLNAAITYKRLKSENFAKIIDLLGANGYLDVDAFANDLQNMPNQVQNNLQNPNRIVSEGDKFKYNYNLYANVINSYAQVQFRYNKVDFYLAGSLTNTKYQREGLYENGAFPGIESFGKDSEINFISYGIKAGLIYKITGKHLINFNGAYITRAPSLRNSYSNPRENHNIVGSLNGLSISEEKILSTDASYIFRSSIINARLTVFYTRIDAANEISFYYADGIGGDNSAFIQEVLQGVEKQHLGGELGIEAKVTPTITLKGAASVGQYIYANNPNLYLTTEPNTQSEAAGFVNGYRNFGTSKLKNYHISGGPQTACSVGFEYRDPDFWWFGTTANFFNNTYIDVSPLTRTTNFTTDSDGNKFNDYDENLAKQLLKQEEFGNYITVNLIGGKSWKIDSYYIGFFASVNNLLSETYRTGGFENGRNANYRELRDDKALQTPVFGSKYWYARGATYFLNLYVRF